LSSSGKYDPGFSSRIWTLIFCPSRIQGAKKAPDKKHRIRIRNTGAYLLQCCLVQLCCVKTVCAFPEPSSPQLVLELIGTGRWLPELSFLLRKVKHIGTSRYHFYAHPDSLTAQALLYVTYYVLYRIGTYVQNEAQCI